MEWESEVAEERRQRGKRREKKRQKPAEERGDSGAPHSPTSCVVL